MNWVNWVAQIENLLFNCSLHTALNFISAYVSSLHSDLKKLEDRVCFILHTVQRLLLGTNPLLGIRFIDQYGDWLANMVRVLAKGTMSLALLCLA